MSTKQGPDKVIRNLTDLDSDSKMEIDNGENLPEVKTEPYFQEDSAFPNNTDTHSQHNEELYEHNMAVKSEINTSTDSNWDTKFYMPWDIKDVFPNQEDQAKIYNCGTCQYSSNHLFDLYQHNTSHGMDKVYICDLCQSSYKSFRELKSHLASYTAASENSSQLFHGMKNFRKMNKKRKQYTQSDMEAAVKACRTGLMKIREAATHFNIPRSTLGCKVLGLYPVEPKSRTVLSPEEEAKVVDWVMTSAARGYGQSRQEVCLAIQRILNAERRETPFTDNLPGSKWYYSFLQRHPNLKKSKTMVLGEQRAKVAKDKIQAWFQDVQTNLMKDGIDITSVPPQNVFSVDESGFPFFHQGSVVLMDVKKKHPYTIGSDTKQQITVLCAGSAGGAILAPYIIFPGMKWTYHPWDDFAEAHYDITPNGWVNSEIFLNWLRIVFQPAVKDLPRPVVLFADGHQNHFNMDVHSFCKENGITYYLLPAHASHIVQPLDLIFYGVLKQHWRKSVRDYKRISNAGFVSKESFAVVFKEAWLASHTSAKMVKAFETSGLSPWNPERPDYSKCQASLVYNESAPTPAPTPSPGPTPAPTPSFGLSQAPSPGPSQAQFPSPGPSKAPSPLPGPSKAPLPGPSKAPSSLPGPSTSPSPSPGPSTAPSPLPGPSKAPSPSPEPSKAPSSSPGLSKAPTPSPGPSKAPSTSPEPPQVQTLEPPINVAMKVDQLIDFIISSGWSASDIYSIRQRQWQNIPPGPADTHYKKYLELYDSIVPKPTFENLPLPQKNSNSKSNAALRTQIPKYVSGETFKEFQAQKTREQKDKKDAVEER